MAVDKQSTVISELSPEGGIRLKIKREKTVEDTCKPEWVTEARGSGHGKLVIKRKSPGSVSESPKTTERHGEHRPMLRLSLTASDGSRHSQVKSWSLCEVSPAVDDVASVSELSPACQLQSSPKDSGIDMSSPPHDDGAVCVEPSAGTGIWSVSDSHVGDGPNVEDEKMTGSLEKLESDVGSFVRANNAVHSSSKTSWPDTVSHFDKSEQPKVQSTLRSRGERSALKSFSSNSQKLVNPLAKAHRVGRYQHMLPVNRIRAESNITRRSSLEESPTYNMVVSRTNFSRSPRVKTFKLKLLSNNTYAPIFDQETDCSEQHSADQNRKCLSSEKSAKSALKPKRNKSSHKSSASDAFENAELKCFSDSHHEDDKIQTIPKLKIFVKSEPPVSVSCVDQPLGDTSVIATVKQSEQTVPRHIRQKQRHSEVVKTESSRNRSSDLCHSLVDRDACHRPSKADVRGGRRKQRNSEVKQAADMEPPEKKGKVQSCAKQPTDHLPSLADSQQSQEGVVVDKTWQSIDGKSGDVRGCHRKRRNSEAKEAANMELSEKKNKVQSCAKQPTEHLQSVADSQPLQEDEVIDKTWQSVDDNVSADKTVSEACMETSFFSTHSDEHHSSQSSVYDSSTEAHKAVQDEAGKSESIAADEIMASALSAELDFDVTKSISLQTESEQHCDTCGSCTASTTLTVNAGDIKGQHEETSPPVTEKEVCTTVQQDSISNCSALCDETVSDDKPCAMIADVSAADRPTTDTSSDDSGSSCHPCPASDEHSLSVISEQCVVISSDTVVPLLPSSLVNDNSDAKNMPISLPPHTDSSDINRAESSSVTLKPVAVSEETVSCDTVHSPNRVSVVNNFCSVDSVMPDNQVTEYQDSKQETVDSEEKDFELKSVSSVSHQEQKLGDECKQIDSHCEHLVDASHHFLPLSPSHCNKEHAETSAANGACSSGFLAAFTQFVEKVSVKKKSAVCKSVETDSTLKSQTEVVPKSGSSNPKCARQRPYTAQRKRFTSLEKAALSENEAPSHTVRRKSTSSVECPSDTASLLEVSSSKDFDGSEKLTCTVVDNKHPTLSQEELMDVVSSDCQLVSLRHRVCELVETLLPKFHFPPGFRRDSASVERLVADLIRILSDSKEYVRQCSDPVVKLHRLPDRCLQTFQQQVIRLLSLLLPDTDLSDIDDKSLDVFLEVMTSVNQPLPGAFCVSRPNLLPTCETSPLSLDQLHPSSPCYAETNISEPIETLLSRTEGHFSAVDTLFNVPSSLVQINTPGPVGEKRSIRRQVKDCLMFLDRDLT